MLRAGCGISHLQSQSSYSWMEWEAEQGEWLFLEALRPASLWHIVLETARRTCLRTNFCKLLSDIHICACKLSHTHPHTLHTCTNAYVQNLHTHTQSFFLFYYIHLSSFELNVHPNFSSFPFLLLEIGCSPGWSEFHYLPGPPENINSSLKQIYLSVPNLLQCDNWAMKKLMPNIPGVQISAWKPWKQGSNCEPVCCTLRSPAQLYNGSITQHSLGTILAFLLCGWLRGTELGQEAI